MKTLIHSIAGVLTIAAAILLQTPASGQVADSVDVIDYDISLDLSGGTPFHGRATVTARLLQPCNDFRLYLRGTADTVWVDGTAMATPSVTAVPTAGIAVGDTFTVTVAYHGDGYVEPYGWGGFHFESNIHYNLGVGFDVNPHVLGRAIMPCRDNFHDKATYTLRLKAKAGWTAECSGMLQGRTVGDDGTELSVWRIAQPVPTYLVSVSQAPWHRIEREVVSEDGTYPLTIGYTTQDSASVVQAFAELDSVVPMYERCFGPYRWQRIGYIATPKGSMEHVNNICLDRAFIASMSERAQSTIAHELGHAWFGNLVTCSTEGDMWINEGGASFTSEVAMEAALGRTASDDYYQRNLEQVLRTTHITDAGYRPLSGMPHAYTYGSTTYDKGWMVWHSLRGYLGEELFYSSLRQLMDSKAFGNIDAYALRDSLSSYSGVDLTDFFDFHVFGPGFVDYHVAMSNPGEGCLLNEVEVHIRQQGVGTTNHMRNNRVPLTFYAQPGFDSVSCKRVATFDGEETWEVFSLPFVPAYCVLDADNEFSDAATTAVADLSLAGTSNAASTSHMILKTTDNEEGRFTVVQHHFAPPVGYEAIEGVKRVAGRYWVVTGPQALLPRVQGRFRYTRGNATSATYRYLDRGFLSNTASADSLVLLYRRDAYDRWHAVSHQRNGNGDEGYLLLDTLQNGEYTLAVADMGLLGISTPNDVARTAAVLFPNPVEVGARIAIDAPTTERYSVTILDTTGRRVWRKRNCSNRQSIDPHLVPGTYLVLIENKFVSLQSKLIVK